MDELCDGAATQCGPRDLRVRGQKGARVSCYYLYWHRRFEIACECRVKFLSNQGFPSERKEIQIQGQRSLRFQLGLGILLRGLAVDSNIWNPVLRGVTSLLRVSDDLEKVQSCEESGR